MCLIVNGGKQDCKSCTCPSSDDPQHNWQYAGLYRECSKCHETQDT